MLEIEINENHPNVIKFIANEPLVEGNFEFSSKEEATALSPLASQLFEYSFVEKVFFSSHFILIEKTPQGSLDEIALELKEGIIRFLQSGVPLITKKKQENNQPIEIYIESTPNPQVLKFGLNKFLSETPIEIKSQKETYKSPLAEALFAFPFVNEVFIHGKMISITKNSAIEWDLISNELKKFILNYLSQEKEVIYKEFSKNSDLPKTELEKEIEIFLNEYINPMVAKDGGNIKILSLDEKSKTLRVLLQGACSGCPSSTITLKEGVENALRSKFPSQVSFVEALNT
jgi:NFU1 iron-sulfur cluster scaffold homolog, mitochondrial